MLVGAGLESSGTWPQQLRPYIRVPSNKIAFTECAPLGASFLPEAEITGGHPQEHYAMFRDRSGKRITVNRHGFMRPEVLGLQRPSAESRIEMQGVPAKTDIGR